MSMRRLVVAAVLGLVVKAVLAQTSVPGYAAGSLRAPLTEAARAFEASQPGARIELVFGASGLLRDRICAGEPADVFASANMEHPQSLKGGGWGETRAFARNALCALAPERLGLKPETLVATILDPQVKVGTSTPKADPSGDYAFEMFARIGRSAGAPVGAQAALAAKALQLTGGPNSPAPPAGRNVYGVLVASGQADVFITYCTSAVAAAAEQPGLQLVQVPAAINVTADYGLAVRQSAPAAAQAFADYLLSAAGQAVLQRHGFQRPD
jgi:molybdate transport system substrate-binding protein